MNPFTRRSSGPGGGNQGAGGFSATDTSKAEGSGVRDPGAGVAQFLPLGLVLVEDVIRDDREPTVVTFRSFAVGAGNEPSGQVLGWIGDPSTLGTLGTLVLLLPSGIVGQPRPGLLRIDSGAETRSVRVAVSESNVGEAKAWFDAARSDATLARPSGATVISWPSMKTAAAARGVLVIDGMPEEGQITIDGNRVFPNREPWGWGRGWVGGTPAMHQYVVRDIPVGSHTIVVTSGNGDTKSWTLPIVATVEPEGSQFDMATGRAPEKAVVNRIDWTRQPVASHNETNLPDFTVTLTPTTATTTAGEDISQAYQITTATTGNGTVFNLALSVAATGLTIAGVQHALDKTTLRSGESATLTLTGSKDIPPGSISFTVTASGGTAPSVLAKNVTGTLVVPEKILEEDTDEGGGISTPVIIGGVALLALGAFVVLRMSRKPKTAPRDNPGKKRRRRALARR